MRVLIFVLAASLLVPTAAAATEAQGSGHQICTQAFGFAACVPLPQGVPCPPVVPNGITCD